MSKILKGLNEVNPHNYDSDWDYQDAVASSGRSRSSYRSQEDDTSDADIAYSKKMYQLSQKQKRDADHDRLATGTNEEQLDELSNEKLGQYKTAAAADAGKADKEGDYKRADKRFSGIVKATKKQFANDTKTVKEDINVVYKKAKQLLTQLDENTQQRVINALQKKVDDEQTPFKTGYPRVKNPQILGTQNRAKSIYHPPSKPNVKKLDKPLPENLGNELKSKSLEALQQVKQQLEQQRMADLEQWEKDFKQNTVSKFTAREPNLRQRATSTSMVAMPGEKHSELKTRLGQLNKAIEKQGILDKLVEKLDKKGLLTPNIEAGVDTSMLARDGARDNYVELNKKLDKALEYVKNRLLTNKAAYAKPKGVDEGWSQKYKSSINCSHPKGFSQKAHCAGKKKHNESIDTVMEMTCPDCGMCETHVDHTNLDEACWKGYHKEGNKKMFGKTYPNCVKNESEAVDEADMNRRGFLKGMGAAAVAGSALVNPIVAKAQDSTSARGITKSDLQKKFPNSLDIKATGTRPPSIITDLGLSSGKNLELEVKTTDLLGNSSLGYIEFINDIMVGQFYITDKSNLPKISAFTKKPEIIEYFKNIATRILGTGKLGSAQGKISLDKVNTDQGVGAGVMKGLFEISYDTININVETSNGSINLLVGAYESGNYFVISLITAIKKQQNNLTLDEFNKKVVTEEKCPHCGGEMVSEELMNEKKDACYYKVKSRYKVWPSAYASGALVKCRKKGASNWGTGGKKNESSILEGIERADESLHDWFNKEKWVRMDTKGNIKGPCAKEPGEGKPKCLPQAKAHSLGKKGRASAAQRKRREDPNPERSGKAINVNTKKK
jgi:hypothetical protein